MDNRAPGHRETNVGFAESFLGKQIDQRNRRKEAQESSARWIVLTIVALMTLLLTLSKEAGILTPDTPCLLRVFFVMTLLAATATVGCAGGVLWPRKYEHLGEGGLDPFNKTDFLDQEPHTVKGRVVASYIAITKKMDELHEKKAEWLKAAFLALGITLLFVVAQGFALGIDPPAAKHPTVEGRIFGRSQWAKNSPQRSCISAPLRSVGRPHMPRCRGSR